VSGAADLKTSFGALTFEDVGRGLIASTATGASRAQVGGPAEIRTSFGAVEVALVQGGRHRDELERAVTLRDVAGAAEVRSTFGRIEVRGAPKGVRIVGGNGEVAVSNVGPAFLKTSFGLVQAASVAGSLEVENSNGAVMPRTSRARSPCAPRSRRWCSAAVDGPVVDVRNQNGTVEFDGTAGRACARITLVTRSRPSACGFPKAWVTT